MRTWLKPWFDSLPSSEQTGRQNFCDTFKPRYNAFRDLDMTNARNITVHRTGYPPVRVNITSLFGVSYTGGPVERIPTTASRPGSPADDSADPAVLWAATLSPIPLRPTWNDFQIDGKPLYSECRAYIQRARDLMGLAQGISHQIHGRNTVTPLP
jgi:hypothetical protein